MLCPKCQAQNPEQAKFCRQCGASLVGQKVAAPAPPVAPSPPTPQTTSTGLPQNLAGALCYVLAFVTGIVFLLLEKENKFVRFHAMQSIITFAGLFVLSILLNVISGFIPLLGWMIRVSLSSLVSILGFILWIVLMTKAYQGEMYKLPVIGDLAQKQVEKV